MAQAREHSAVNRHPIACGLALWAFSSLGHAGLHKDPDSACAVAAPSYLASSDYVFQYQGGCKDGLAQGQGRAVWSLKSLPSNKVVWDGPYSQGVYLPPPKGVVSARWLANESALFDLGPLPALPGIAAARLQANSVSDLTNYADACKPRSLWVVNAPLAALVNEDVAKSLLQSAVDKLKVHCGPALNLRDKRGDDRESIAVQVLDTPEVTLDRYRNPPSAAASGFVRIASAAAPEQYHNTAASQKRMQQATSQDQQARQANGQKLQAFFAKHQAQGWAALGDIAQNPFRYANRTVVTAVQLGDVLSPTRAVVSERNGGAGVLDGNGLAEWPAGGRLLAVKVLGRLDDPAYKGFAHLQLVGNEACSERDCQDWLRLSAPLLDGQVP